MFCEKIILNEKRNVSLTCYIQEGNIKRPAMIVLPGGAYVWCSDREADPVAQAYLHAGYHAFVLRYSVKEHQTWPSPLEDYDMAMELIRSKSDEWKIYSDKIAVIGFSAGGHLAAAAATMSKNRPNAALIGYGVVSEDVKGCNESAPDTTKYVDKNTPPCFIFSSRTDNVVPIHNSLRFMMALDEHHIAFESHIYAYGPHGFSTVASVIMDRDRPICNRTKNWVNDSIEWLKDVFGDFKEDYMTKPTCNRYINGDYDEYLSLDCTLGHLYAIPEAREAIAKYAPMDRNIENAKKMTLRGVLGFTPITKEQVKEIEEKLIKIKNITL